MRIATLMASLIATALVVAVWLASTGNSERELGQSPPGLLGPDSASGRRIGNASEIVPEDQGQSTADGGVEADEARLRFVDSITETPLSGVEVSLIKNSDKEYLGSTDPKGCLSLSLPADRESQSTQVLAVVSSGGDKLTFERDIPPAEGLSTVSLPVYSAADVILVRKSGDNRNIDHIERHVEMLPHPEIPANIIAPAQRTELEHMRYSPRRYLRELHRIGEAEFRLVETRSDQNRIVLHAPFSGPSVIVATSERSARVDMVEVALVRGQVVSATLELADSIVVSGVVKRLDGETLKGASVTFAAKRPLSPGERLNAHPSITVVVGDLPNGDRIGAIRITKKTDSRGRFRFEVPFTGNFTVSVAGEGHSAWRNEFSVGLLESLKNIKVELSERDSRSMQLLVDDVPVKQGAPCYFTDPSADTLTTPAIGPVSVGPDGHVDISDLVDGKRYYITVGQRIDLVLSTMKFTARDNGRIRVQSK